MWQPKNTRKMPHGRSVERLRPPSCCNKSHSLGGVNKIVFPKGTSKGTSYVAEKVQCGVSFFVDSNDRREVTW